MTDRRAVRIPLYQVDAFVSEDCRGNPAAICPLKTWLPDVRMQAIALENGLSETAFLVRKAVRHYELRWFTPAAEVNLCGHATLASAWVVFHRLEASGEIEAPAEMEGSVAEGGERQGGDTVVFETRSGRLEVERRGATLAMDLPVRPARRCDPLPPLVRALGREPEEVWAASRDYMAVYRTETEVRDIRPDMMALTALELPGVIVTARGERCDFVSRFFAPGLGVPEDPVTGSAHCTLVPFWAERLGKFALVARQISERGGELLCEQRGDRVRVAGRALLVREGSV